MAGSSLTTLIQSFMKSVITTTTRFLVIKPQSQTTSTPPESHSHGQVDDESPNFPTSTGHAAEKQEVEVVASGSNSSNLPIPIPIPTVEQCVIHLQLLELFVVLRGWVEAWAESHSLNSDQVWQKFVELAVSRFTIWFQTANPDVVRMKTSIPPLDVLMVWHTFMLNPVTYQVFCKGARPDDNAGMSGIDWLQLKRAIHAKSQFRLSEEDVAIIRSLGLDPDPLAVFNPTLPRETRGGKVLGDSLITFLLSHSQQKIENRTDPNLSTTLLDMHSKLQSTNFSFTHKDYSLDLNLVDAIQRQAEFASKMSRFGWHHNSPFNISFLDQAQQRYLRFFSLISSLPLGENMHTVPTLDIDLVWHTHQLSPEQYSLFCQSRMPNAQLVDHNDAITQEVISSGSINTATRYREQYGEIYSICQSWCCQAARASPKKRLSRKDKEKIRKAIDNTVKTRPSNKWLKLDLASCRCHETKLPSTSRFGLNLKRDKKTTTGSTSGGGCTAPPASNCAGAGGGGCSPDVGCGGCGGCGGGCSSGTGTTKSAAPQASCG